MSKQLRYMGEFLSRAGVVWRVEILQEAPTPFEVVGDLTFEADEALVIEWEHKDKDEVICGSIATIQIESPGDRTYEDLYAIEVGSIRMDVYRENKLYWSGALDPEFYEEPYEKASNYVVTLTFSDFGVLERLKYDLAGMQTIGAVLRYALARTAINYGGIDQSCISTELNGKVLTMDAIQVRSDNFYDEDGEASTLQEVIEGMLQPLALRMVQRAGKVYIYDLNGLYNNAPKKAVEWDGDSSTMSTDKVYNNAKITWNTYAQSGNLAQTECWTEEVDKNAIALNMVSGRQYGNCTLFSYHYSGDLYDWIDATDCGFSLWISQKGKGLTLNSDRARFFKIVPQYDGQESEGVAILWSGVAGIKVGGGRNWSASMQWQGFGTGANALANVKNKCGARLFSTAPVWVPPVDNAYDLVLRASINMLMDPRFNPFEQASNLMKYVEQKDWYSQWEARGNFMYVPVTIKFKPTGSNDVYVWDNRSVVTQSIKSPVRTLGATYGSWTRFSGSDDAPGAFGYLAYYDAEDRAEKAGVLGWKKNRPAINPHTDKIASILKKCDAGQYIPYPNYGGKGGELWIEVHAGGWLLSDGNAELADSKIIDSYGLWGKYWFILMEMPELEVMNSLQFDKTINTDDIEYNAEINGAAKEEIKIETICGTAPGGVPTARGAYFDATTGRQITALTRVGRTTQAEELLIGTLYSQYAERRTTLSGEVVLPADGIAVYTEQNQAGKVFMISEDIQDAIADTSEASYTELHPDEYKKRQ